MVSARLRVREASEGRVTESPAHEELGETDSVRPLALHYKVNDAHGIDLFKSFVWDYFGRDWRTICSSRSTWAAKALRPAAVRLQVVRGRLFSKALVTAT